MTLMLQPAYDLAILGSGFGGSLLSMMAKRIGLSVVMIERGRHPRFAIGESTSPLTNLILEQIARRYDLPRLLPLTSYGPWMRNYPEIARGLKRGFTFFHHEKGVPYRTAADRSNQLLVAASPDDDVADTHWLRSDVDMFLMREAVALGVDYLDEVEPGLPEWSANGVTFVGRRRGEPVRILARFVVDATGPRGFLGKALDIPESPIPNYPKTQTLFSHFTGVRRCDTMDEFRAGGETPPYRLDDAALHHVFDGGWMWVLRFDNGVTSAGIAVDEELAIDIGIQDGQAAWPRFLRRYPSIAAQFAEAVPIRPFTFGSRLSYRASRMVGNGWAMLPSAAAFVDPLFSTGFPLNLLGVERLGRIFEQEWGTGAFADRLGEYAARSRAEVDAVAGLIAGAYGGMSNFPAFAALSMFYFTAASYSEMQRRLDDRADAFERPAFLQSSHPTFGPAMSRISAVVRDRGRALAPADVRSLDAEIASATDCINVAGLCDPSKRNWYGVDLDDVVRGAAKLGFTPEEMREILRRADWARYD